MITLLLAFPLIAVACGSSGGGDASDSSAPAAADSENAVNDDAAANDDEAANDDAATNDDTTGDESPSGGGDGPVAVDQIEPSAPDVTVSGLSIARGGSSEGAPEPLMDLNELLAGGPPPDGIPSIDDPKFLKPSEVDFLEENEPVLAVEIDGDARAYPVQILIWHEIVNDTIGGLPIAITYCPLCNSAVAYDRRVGDQVLEFGTSGMLWNSALVMYDRQTETLWSHFTGEGIVGELTGTEIDDFPVATLSWAAWRDANPDGLVLSRDTGFDRSYGRNPYPGYDDVDSSPFLFQGEVDGQFAAMTRIAGVELNDDALGVPLEKLQEDQVVEAEVGGTDIVIFWASGTASSLDAGSVSGGDDVGATGIFTPVADGQDLTFQAVDGSFLDDQTGSTWNILGQAVAGPLEGSELEALSHVNTFWFAWSTFRPDTKIIE